MRAGWQDRCAAQFWFTPKYANSDGKLQLSLLSKTDKSIGHLMTQSKQMERKII
jgi:hypothetical protein